MLRYCMLSSTISIRNAESALESLPLPWSSRSKFSNAFERLCFHIAGSNVGALVASDFCSETACSCTASNETMVTRTSFCSCLAACSDSTAARVDFPAAGRPQSTTISTPLGLEGFDSVMRNFRRSNRANFASCGHVQLNTLRMQQDVQDGGEHVSMTVRNRARSSASSVTANSRIPGRHASASACFDARTSSIISCDGGAVRCCSAAGARPQRGRRGQAGHTRQCRRAGSSCYFVVHGQLCLRGAERGSAHEPDP